MVRWRPSVRTQRTGRTSGGEPGRLPGACIRTRSTSSVIVARTGSDSGIATKTTWPGSSGWIQRPGLSVRPHDGADPRRAALARVPRRPRRRRSARSHPCDRRRRPSCGQVPRPKTRGKPRALVRRDVAPSAKRASKRSPRTAPLCSGPSYSTDASCFSAAASQEGVVRTAGSEARAPATCPLIATKPSRGSAGSRPRRSRAPQRAHPKVRERGPQGTTRASARISRDVQSLYRRSSISFSCTVRPAGSKQENSKCFSNSTSTLSRPPRFFSTESTTQSRKRCAW